MMRLHQRKAVRRTTLISVGLLAALVGLYLPYAGISIGTFGLFLIPVFVLGIVGLKKLRLVSVIALGLMVGLWRGSVVYMDLQKYQLLYKTEVHFIGTVSDDPGFNSERSQTEFSLGSISYNRTKLIGRVQVGVREDPALSRGDVVQVSGSLRPLKGTSKQGFISLAEVKILKQDNSWLGRVRERFFKSIRAALAQPYSSLGLGYLVGLRADIPTELSDQLKIVGLTHIIAVSGYNLTVIVQAIRRMFAHRSAYQEVLFTSILISGFLLITGGSAPIVRAAVVCGFSLVAWYYGREVKPVLLLLLSGALTAVVNPLYVWGDPGWYLSFLAFAGVLILAPLITRFIYRKKQPGTIVQIFTETVCAQATTIPYTLYLFGTVSIIAPIANLLVLPLIPVIMLLVFTLGLLGMVIPVLAGIISLVPGALLTLQVWWIQKLSSVPSASTELSISLLGMITLFGGLLLLIFVLTKVTSIRNETASEVDYNLL